MDFEWEQPLYYNQDYKKTKYVTLIAIKKLVLVSPSAILTMSKNTQKSLLYGATLIRYLVGRNGP